RCPSADTDEETFKRGFREDREAEAGNGNALMKRDAAHSSCELFVFLGDPKHDRLRAGVVHHRGKDTRFLRKVSPASQLFILCHDGKSCQSSPSVSFSS